MKKRLSIILASLIASLLVLSACGTGDGTGTPPPPPLDGELVYEAGTMVRIISAENDKTTDKSSVISAIQKATGVMPGTFFDVSAPGEHEIVIGNTSREITNFAREYADSLGISLLARFYIHRDIIDKPTLDNFGKTVGVKAVRIELYLISEAL